MNSWDSFIYKSIQKLKSKTSLKILNTLTNNDDLIQICDHIYLGNVTSAHNAQLLEETNIQALVNCTNDIPIHVYFKDKMYIQLNIEDSKDNKNIEKFKNIIIKTVYFIDEQVKKKHNVIIHCYWGFMRSPSVIACYLIYKYKMDVDSAIEFTRSKKNFAFTKMYNFRELLEFVYDHFHN